MILPNVLMLVGRFFFFWHFTYIMAFSLEHQGFCWKILIYIYWSSIINDRSLLSAFKTLGLDFGNLIVFLSSFQRPCSFEGMLCLMNLGVHFQRDHLKSYCSLQSLPFLSSINCQVITVAHEALMLGCSSACWTHSLILAHFCLSCPQLTFLKYS